MNKTLTHKEIQALPDGSHAIGGVKGLYVRKRAEQTQYFLRWKKDGKQQTRFYAIGLSLREVREIAYRDRQLLNLGLDPKEEEKKAQAAKEAEIEAKRKEEERRRFTFRLVSDEWLKEQIQIQRWKNNVTGEKHARQRLNKYLLPAFGDKLISEITAQDAFLFFSPLWTAKSGTADKLYDLLKAIFNWAIAKGTYQITENPINKRGALGILLEPLTKQRTDTDNHPSLDFHEVPQFIEALTKLGSPSALAVAFSIVTASRFKAVRCAEWSEIDLKNKVWNIPEEHDKMKGRRMRQVLLSDEAIELLSYLPRVNNYLFPSGSHLGKLSENAPSMLIRGMDTQKAAIDGRGWKDFTRRNGAGKIEPVRITQHGTARASFRTWAKNDELGNNRKFDQEAVELCLLHARKDTYRGAYDRSQLLKERRLVMKEWGAFCFSALRASQKEGA
ncbi:MULTISPECIES: tyrosine-type recombinase/integrase [Parasutterella]|jgi:integrase|uniref:tyrosine-type recombinase/integrase n=1 Tax=Parasutterella TaxID=577310 RepID=UPI00307A22AE